MSTTTEQLRRWDVREMYGPVSYEEAKQAHGRTRRLWDEVITAPRY